MFPVGADGGVPTIATLLALAAVVADTHPITLAASAVLAAVGALVAFFIGLQSFVTLETGLEAAAEAVHLETVGEEVLLTA